MTEFIGSEFLSNDYLKFLADTDPTTYAALWGKHTLIGYHPKTKDQLWLSDIDRRKSTYIIGVAGSGKSSLMKNIVHEDIRKPYATICIDMHDDFADQVVAEMDAEQVGRTFMLDIRNERHPYTLNVFEGAGTFKTESERAAAVDRTYLIFKTLWPEIKEQKNLPMLLRLAVLTFLDNPGTTLPDMMRFFDPKDATYRHQLLRNVSDPSIAKFFADEYDSLREDMRRTRSQPLITRLHSLFTGNSLVKNVLGSPDSSVNFRKVIDNHEIVLIKLPRADLGEIADLIGTIVIAMITTATFSYVDTPASQRPGYSLVVDEFAKLTTPGFEVIVSELRKFGAMLTICHQTRAQLREDLRETTMSAGTKIVLQTTPNDAKELAQLFPSPPAEVDKVDHKVCDELLDHGSDYPAEVRDFVNHYLIPMDQNRKAGKVTIKSWKNRPLIDFGQPVFGGHVAEDHEERDPTIALNRLLYEVMTQHTPHLSIPYEAAIGFSHCGRGFYNTLKYLGQHKLDKVSYPSHLVINGRWARPPDDGNEQLYHFIFHLRRMMAYLAKHPIGRSSTPSQAAVANWISSLPPRTAYVRYGKSYDAIRTYDTPKPVVGAELNLRAAQIQMQTRRKYCRPRPEPPGTAVAMPVPDLPPDDFDPAKTVSVRAVKRMPRDTLPISGWGEADQP